MEELRQYSTKIQQRIMNQLYEIQLLALAPKIRLHSVGRRCYIDLAYKYDSGHDSAYPFEEDKTFMIILAKNHPFGSPQLLMRSGVYNDVSLNDCRDLLYSVLGKWSPEFSLSQIVNSVSAYMIRLKHMIEEAPGQIPNQGGYVCYSEIPKCVLLSSEAIPFQVIVKAEAIKGLAEKGNLRAMLVIGSKQIALLMYVNSQILRLVKVENIKKVELPITLSLGGQLSLQFRGEQVQLKFEDSNEKSLFLKFVDQKKCTKSFKEYLVKNADTFSTFDQFFLRKKLELAQKRLRNEEQQHEDSAKPMQSDRANYLLNEITVLQGILGQDSARASLKKLQSQHTQH